MFRVLTKQAFSRTFSDHVSLREEILSVLLLRKDSVAVLSPFKILDRRVTFPQLAWQAGLMILWALETCLPSSLPQ